MNNEGGYAECKIVQLDACRSSVRIGDKRLFDLVCVGNELFAEYKPGKKKAIQANARDLIAQLARRLAGTDPPRAEIPASEDEREGRRNVRRKEPPYNPVNS